MEPRFITNEPVLVIGDRLIIADLHIGIEYEYWKSGVKIPSFLEKAIPRLVKLLKANKAKKLMILGDVKQAVPGISWQELKELPELFRRIGKIAEIEIVPGNHDGQIEKQVLKGVRVYPRSGVLLGDVYFTHGHTWPDESFVKAKHLVMGHVHPGVEFKSELGYRWVEEVWMRAELDPEKIKEKYKTSGHLPKVIIMPKFNHYAGTVAMNKSEDEINRNLSESPGPIMKIIKFPKAKTYLLDGTYLGEIRKLI